MEEMFNKKLGTENFTEWLKKQKEPKLFDSGIFIGFMIKKEVKRMIKNKFIKKVNIKGWKNVYCTTPDEYLQKIYDQELNSTKKENL